MVTTLGTSWDFSVYNRGGQLALVGEVKRKTNVSPEWATTLRRNILGHGTLPKAPHFLMAFPDRLYLWSNEDAYDNQSGPTYAVDAQPIFHPYFERAGVTAEQISGPSLELIVASWLGEIIHSDNLPDETDDSLRWLIDSGLRAALLGGKFEYEAAA